MKIGDLAKKTGLAASAIRYYEAAGILPRAARISGRRVYDESALIRLNLIAMAQSVGFTLAEITELLRAVDRDGWRPAKFEAFAQRKIAEIDAKANQLAHMRSLLETSRACDCLSLNTCTLFAQASAQRAPKSVRTRANR
jgi:MerR family redox-sensitive transcriptional activator SoxR